VTALQLGDPSAPSQMWITVDQWSEILPLHFTPSPPPPETDPPTPADPSDGRQHEAAVSLRVDSPDSRPPQALLLVVPPAPQRGWLFQDVQNSVDQTLTWTMLRPLDGDDLPEYAVTHD
jgi:hypothetical protein